MRGGRIGRNTFPPQKSKFTGRKQNWKNLKPKNLASEHCQKDPENVEVNPGNISKGHVWMRREGNKAKLEAGGRVGGPSASSCSLRAKLACLHDEGPGGRMD